MTASTMTDRRHRLAWIGMPVGGVGIIAGAFAPWAMSGRVSRSAFQLADLAGRLGALDAVPLGAAFALPLLCAVPTILLALRLVRTAGAVAAAVSLAALTGAVVALFGLGDRAAGMVRIAAAGPAVTAAAAAFLLIAAASTVRWERSPRRTSQVPRSAATPPVASHERDVTP
jgi:hypothetical protein